ncbi:hypothetical protein DPMN_174575 [Dreissena polymorpha]|uniref:Uncharacterized protein n=1 Tax=Dreissena polymorpha TaxID=45954 RepID=A0A9D4E5L7_DREPO|nr:hypothetical protein DPMN_174575 [Dreissena polymorpha]
MVLNTHQRARCFEAFVSNHRVEEAHHFEARFPNQLTEEACVSNQTGEEAHQWLGSH